MREREGGGRGTGGFDGGEEGREERECRGGGSGKQGKTGGRRMAACGSQRLARLEGFRAAASPPAAGGSLSLPAHPTHSPPLSRAPAPRQHLQTLGSWWGRVRGKQDLCIIHFHVHECERCAAGAMEMFPRMISDTKYATLILCAISLHVGIGEQPPSPPPTTADAVQGRRGGSSWRIKRDVLPSFS